MQPVSRAVWSWILAGLYLAAWPGLASAQLPQDLPRNRPPQWEPPRGEAAKDASAASSALTGAEFAKALERDASGAQPSASCEPTAEMCSAWQAAQVEWWTQQRWIHKHHRKVFEQHHAESKFIPFVVLFVLLLGLYLSWKQVSAGFPPAAPAPVTDRNRPADAEVPAAAPSPATPPSRATPAAPMSTIKVGKDGVEISSPILGVFVLALSMGFTYLYLTEVYPITPIDVGAQPEDESDGDDDE